RGRGARRTVTATETSPVNARTVPATPSNRRPTSFTKPSAMRVAARGRERGPAVVVAGTVVVGAGIVSVPAEGAAVVDGIVVAGAVAVVDVLDDPPDCSAASASR